MKASTLLTSFLASSILLGSASHLLAQSTRTWSGNSQAAWLTLGNWTPNTTFAGETPQVNPTGEGQATDIMTTVETNSATNIALNMSVAGANGGVGLILGAIELNKTNATTLVIGNSSTSTQNGILQLNGATINGVDKTLIRVAGSADLTIANVNTGTTPVTMGLRLGITDGIFQVASGRTLTVSSNITQANDSSVLTKTGAGTMVLAGTNSYTGGTSVTAGTLQCTIPAAMPATGTVAVGTGTALALNIGGIGQFTTATSGNGSLGAVLAGVGGQGAPVTYAGAVSLVLTTANATAAQTYAGNIADVGTALSVVKTGANALTLSGTNAYTGVTSVNGGTLSVSGDHTAANGGWSITVDGNANFQSGSKIAVASGRSITFGNGAGSAQRSLNVSGTVTNNGNLNLYGRNTLNLESGASWTQTGTMTVQPLNTSFSVVMNVKTGSSFAYNGSANVALARSTGTNTSSATLNLSGGTFTTSRAISNANAGTGTGSTNLNFTEGGTLKISTNLPSLIVQNATTPQPFTVTMGPGGGVIDTNQYNSAIAVPISGAAGLTKKGSGVLSLTSATSSYAGATVIAEGVLEAAVLADGGLASSIGQSANFPESLVIGDGAALRYTGAGASTDRTFRMSGPAGGKAIVDASGTGAVQFTSSINPDQTTADAAYTLELSGSNAADNTFAAVLADNGLGARSLIKSGVGTWVLTANNGYTGSTNITGGRLKLSNTASIATSASVAILAGAVLDTTAQANYAVPAAQTLTFGINPAGFGSAGVLAAADLNIASAKIQYDIASTLNDPVYILATYSGTLTGSATATVPTPPTGYVLDFAHEGNKIALVGPPAVGFAKWQITNVALGELNEDHDNDGVPNGVEYFTGGPNGNTTGFTTLPTVVESFGVRSVTWTHAADYTGTYGAHFRVETSSDLQNPWTVESLGGNVTVSGNQVKYTFPTGTRGFARLVVTGP
jgi:fibronectin-binding autotransporter adhesin